MWIIEFAMEMEKNFFLYIFTPKLYEAEFARGSLLRLP